MIRRSKLALPTFIRCAGALRLVSIYFSSHRNGFSPARNRKIPAYRKDEGYYRLSSPQEEKPRFSAALVSVCDALATLSGARLQRHGTDFSRDLARESDAGLPCLRGLRIRGQDCAHSLWPG